MSGRTRLRAAVLLAALASAPGARAVQPDEILRDPKLESRARTISAELRCLVCQNQSIDDSDAPLARDLRLLVRERLQAGDSDREVVRFVANRYGDFVLLKPPFTAETLVLWLGPAALALGAATAIWAARRRVPPPAFAGPLSEAEEAALRRALDDA